MSSRNTQTLNHLLHILDASNRPLSVSQIIELFEKIGRYPNKSTVYRIIDKLIQKKEVVAISIKNGTTYYELAKRGGHSHFICNRCDTVFCLDGTDAMVRYGNPIINASKQQFMVQSHELNFYGICDPCTSPN